MGRKVLNFAAPCLNVVESSYYAFKGQFNLGASVNLLFIKAGFKWVFQVGSLAALSMLQFV